MRGLSVFISDIRSCGSKEAEMKHINKELANIRSKFKGDKTLSGYQKKKYVCKLLFIFLLGHDIEFGHSEAVNLLCCSRFSEKQIGYLFISVLSFDKHHLTNLITSRMREDLRCQNQFIANLALQCMSNIATVEIAENFAEDVMKMLISSDAPPSIKQSAALCLVAFLRAKSNISVTADWKYRITQLLMDVDLGLFSTVVSLINQLTKHDTAGFEACYSPLVSRLDSLHCSKYMDLQDYNYYFIPVPWLVVNILRLLQNFPLPHDVVVRNKLSAALDAILATTNESPKSKKVQHSNAKLAVLIEAINLIHQMNCSPNQAAQACNQLGQLLRHKESNYRYLAIGCLVQYAGSELGHEAVKKHQDTIISELKNEQDISIRKRAVDLLYAMCDRSNAETIVSEMLAYLGSAEHGIREELVLKIAILAEKYATDFQWYVDVMLNLLRVAGDFVSEEVCQRVIQIVVNQESVQGYAAKVVFEALQAPVCHENMLKVGGYILGEYGNLISGDPPSSPKEQFLSLHSKFGFCSSTTRQMLLSTYIKFVNLFPEEKRTIEAFFMSDHIRRSPDVEIQQRALEYTYLCQKSSEFLATILEEMPPFPEHESTILAKLKSKNADVDLNRFHRSDNNTPTVTTMNDETSNITVLGNDKSSPIDAFHSNVQSGGANTNQDLLFNLLDDEPASNLFFASQQPSASEIVTMKDISHLLGKGCAALLDNNVIQIGYRLETKQHMTRITLFYGNKSNQPINKFSTRIQWDDVSNPAEMSSYVQADLQPCNAFIEAGVQMQQVLNVMACKPFTQTADLIVTFFTNGRQHEYTLTLPITLCLFLQPNQMPQDQYLTRWRGLSQPGLESIEEFRSLHPFDGSIVRSKLLAYGVSVLDGIDPKVQNFVGAALFSAKDGQAGILYRLEPFPSSQMYRLTVRSTHTVVAKRICDLLRMQL